MKTLPTRVKAGIVVGGYIIAVLFAYGATAIYIHLTDGPERVASSGMYAFGDALLFVALLGSFSAVPTGLAIVFLRERRGFWIASSVVALAVASTSLATVAVNFLEQQRGAFNAGLNLWAMLAFPRIFVSPFFAALFGFSALVAREWRFRAILLVAATMEGASSVYGFLHWFAPLFFQ